MTDETTAIEAEAAAPEAVKTENETAPAVEVAAPEAAATETTEATEEIAAA
jgi:hypothetical protein